MVWSQINPLVFSRGSVSTGDQGESSITEFMGQLGNNRKAIVKDGL